MNKLLQFHELKENKVYRLLHGEEKDYGIDYILVNGKLFDKTRYKFSSLPFNNNIRFIEKDVKIKNYNSLEFEVEFSTDGIKVGCQNIAKKDAMQLANDILDMYYKGFAEEDIPF